MRPQRSHIMLYAVAAILVIILGALVGWYFFVRNEVAQTSQNDAARGFGDSASFGSVIGSALENLTGGVFGSSGTNGATAPQEGKAAPRIWIVNRTPVAGFGFDASTTRMFYAERASGNILRADPSKTFTERLTNTLFPKIYEALFARDGAVVLRSLSDTGIITSYAARLATSSSPATGDTPFVLSGVYLPQNITAIAARSAPDSLVFLLPDPAGGSTLIASDWRGGSQKKVISSSLAQWQIALLQDGTMYMSQKPSDDVETFAFQVKNNALSQMLSELPGLLVLPRTNSTALLYSTSGNGTIALYARASAQAKEIRLPIRTLASKCVWAPGPQLIAYCAVPQTTPGVSYEKLWFEGALHTADAWWKIDVAAGTAEQIYQPDPSTVFDVENPRIDDSGEYIGFMNASDKSLWMFTIRS